MKASWQPTGEYCISEAGFLGGRDMPILFGLAACLYNAADLLGLSSEAGTIEAGKSADIIAVTGDPLADVTVLKTVDFVMVRGEVVKGAAPR